MRITPPPRAPRASPPGLASPRLASSALTSAYSAGPTAGLSCCAELSCLTSSEAVVDDGTGRNSGNAVPNPPPKVGGGAAKASAFGAAVIRGSRYCVWGTWDCILAMGEPKDVSLGDFGAPWTLLMSGSSFQILGFGAQGAGTEPLAIEFAGWWPWFVYELSSMPGDKR